MVKNYVFSNLYFRFDFFCKERVRNYIYGVILFFIELLSLIYCITVVMYWEFVAILVI